MGVKLLHSDARRLRVELIESCNQLEELWAKAERPPPDKILAAWTIQRKLREKIIKSRSDREEMEAFLRNREVWDNMDQRPVHLKAAHSKDDWRDDWNGAKFLGLSVKGKLFLYKNALFDVTGLLSPEEAAILVVEKCASEKSGAEYTKFRREGRHQNIEIRREHIPEHVRNEVWRRDQGKCVECGSMVRIEFDDIIPVSKGGSNTARNLRILCEGCNRHKSDRIG